jgi:branched-chain amino acid transport system ATP-binding protein
METLVGAARRIGIRAIIQVEHDMDIVFGYSDRIVALHEGRVLADGPPESIRADASVVATVLGRAQPRQPETGYPRPDPGTPPSLQ